MPKHSNNNKDMRRGDRTRQAKDEFGAKAHHMSVKNKDMLFKGSKRQGRI